MKLKLFVLILLSVPTIGFGQNSWKELQSNKVKQVTVTKWQVQKDESRKQSGDQTRVVKGYDQNGDLIYVTKYITFRNVKSDSLTYKYDTDHRIIEISLYKFNEQNPNGYLVERQTKKYNEDNNEVYNSTESNNKKFECEYSYKYDKEKKLIEKTLDFTGGRFDKEVIKYEYDKKGNLVLETSSLSTPVKYIIKYSKSGKMESRLNLGKSKQEFFDDNGNIIQITQPGNDTYLKYNSENKVVELMEKTQSSITGPSKYGFQYDSKGHLIEKSDISNKRNLEPTEKWIYNESGLLIEYIKGTELEKYEYVFY
jgi:hypothetical protein